MGPPYKYASITRELNYRLRVKYNNSNLVPKNVITPSTLSTPTAYTQINFVQMNQEVSSIALWNLVASIIFASSLLPIQATQTSLPKDVGNNNTNFYRYWEQLKLIAAHHGFLYSGGWEQSVQTDGGL